MKKSPSITFALALLLAPAGAWAQTTAASFATTSRLAKGHWVKVRVDQPGIQAIPDDTLRAWGFSDPARVRVYGYSTIEQHPSITVTPTPDDLPLAPSARQGGKLLFYGEGVRRDLLNFLDGEPQPYHLTTVRATHSNHTYYFLSDVACRDDDPLGQGNYVETALPKAETHRALQVWQPEQYARLDAGAILYSYPVDAVRPYAFDFEMPGWKGDTWLGYRVVGYADHAWKVPLKLPDNMAADNSREAAVASLSKPNDYYLYTASDWGAYPVTPADQGKGRYTAAVEFPADENVEFLSARTAYLTYERDNALGQQAQMEMQFPGVEGDLRVMLPDAPADAQLWDVTAPCQAVAYPVSGAAGSKSATVTCGGAGRFVLFSPSRQLPQPQWAGEVPNQSLHSLAGTAEMVIVSNDLLLPQARELAALHRDSHQKMKVEVVTQQQIFNEFSSGARSAEAVRKFLQMNWMRGNKKLKYALMFGAGTWDNRAHLGHDTGDYVVTYQNDSIGILRNEAICTATDMFFGMLDPARETPAGKCKTDLADGKQPVSIAVGRIPARDASEARGYVSKARTYFTAPEQAGDYNTVMCIGDLCDQNQHVTKGVDADADTIAKYGRGGATFLKVYQELYSTPERMRRELDAAFSNPVSLVLYSGHSNQHSLGKIVFIDQANEPDITYGSMPVMFSAACSPLGIDQEKRGLLGQMLVRPDNGPVAIVGAHRTVFMNPNQAFEHEFSRQFAKATSSDRIGDVYLRAYNQMIRPSTSTWTLRRNTLCYSMAGDPALPVYAPMYEAVATEIDGKAIDGTPTLTPGKATKLSGEIRNDKGTRMTLDGSVTVDIYDAPYLARLGERHATDKGVETWVNLDQQRLTSVTASVKAGRWTAEFTAPEPPTPRMTVDTAGVAVTPTYRITLSAINGQRNSHLTERPQRAFGHLTAHYAPADPSAAPVADDQAPEILEFALEDAGDGQAVGSDVYVVAVVRDLGSGMCLSPLNDGPRMQRDGKTIPEVATRFRGSGDGTYTLRLPLTALGDGRHTLTLQVCDNARNRAEAELDFVVDSSDAQATLTADRAVARRDITLDIEQTLSAAHGTPEVALRIDDADGQTVQTLTGATFPYTLDVASLADGAYTVTALLRTPNRAFHSAPLKFTVLKPKA